MEIFLWILSLVLAYLIGSISPAYILGKLVKKIDIRKYGSKNAGAMNAGHVIGKWAGVITAMFDMLKGIIAFYITLLIFQAPMNVPNASLIPLAAYFAGFFAILGHDFPFYLNFKGGKGAATTYGFIILLSIFLFRSILNNFGLPMLMPLIFSGAVFVICGSIFYYIQRSGNLTAFIFVPIWLTVIWINAIRFNLIILASALTFFLLYVIFTSIITTKNLKNLKKDMKFGKRKKKKIKVLRKLLRLATIIFPLLYFVMSKFWLLVLIGVIFLFFISQDIARVLKKKHLKKLYKKSDKKISNLSLFLIGCIITVAFFAKEYAIIALSMLVVGDLFAEIIGIKFGKKMLIFNKSLEGSLACFVSSLIIGLLLMPFLNIGIYVVVIAAAVVMLTELVSAWLDNLTIAPITALVLRLLPF